MSVASIINPREGTILPQYLPNGMVRFFSTYPPFIIEEVKNNSGKLLGTRSRQEGLTYTELISRIEALEQANQELKSTLQSMIRNNSSSVGYYSALSSPKERRKTRKARRS
jgi:hypothetical protein